MNESRLDVAQLQKRDPAAWTALLSARAGLENVVVTAVNAKPLYANKRRNGQNSHLIRFFISLANHSDPITFIGKRTSLTEAYFYQQTEVKRPLTAPTCLYTHITKDSAWLILDDVPNHFRPNEWKADSVEHIISEMATQHASYWQQEQMLKTCDWLPHFIGKEKHATSMEQLRQEQAVFFEEGPAAILSHHAIQNAGRLATSLLRAANGLVVMRDLGGWPGVMGESHLAAAADLLDDPVPMLEKLRHLPRTLLHGSPHSTHWHITLFDDNRLFDWRKVMLGPGIWDLVCFLEQFELLYANDNSRNVLLRENWPITEETIIDSYLLQMKAELGKQFDARRMRQAIPAARCLYILTSWFGHFASWFNQMPNKYVWLRANQMSDTDLVGTALQPIVGYRPYLTAVFRRFLRAYRQL